MDRPRVEAGIAGVLALSLTAASCAGDARGEAALAASVGDWKIFSAGDANGDGLADVFWWSASADALAVWLMHGTRVLAPGPVIPGPPGAGWTAVSSGDFNHDGYDDVLWSNADRGTMAVWLLHGVHLLAAGPEIHGPPGAGWVVGNAGDANGDGMADAVWHNAARRRFAVWLMDGARLLAAGPELPSPPGEGWVITNLSDTNGDGLADVVWSNTRTGTMSVTLLHGARLLAPGPEIAGPPGRGWKAITAADFNRDGYDDVIWTNPDRGAMAVWLSRGARLLAPGPVIAGPPGGGWAIAYAGDTNGDGMADAIWQKAGTTLFSVWLMDGARVLAPGPVLAGPGERP